MVHKQNERAVLEPLLTTKDLTKILRVSGRTVARWCAAGILPAPLTIGGSLRWEPSSIRAIICTHTDTKPKKGGV